MTTGFAFSHNDGLWVVKYCEKNNIECQIWNADEVLMNTAHRIEIDFDTPEDLHKVQAALKASRS
jgi:hypothetical protein